MSQMQTISIDTEVECGLANEIREPSREIQKKYDEDSPTERENTVRRKGDFNEKNIISNI